MTGRAQAYKLTVEFLLKDRGDYESYRRDFEKLIRGLEGPRIQIDYIAIEKAAS